MKDLLDIRIHDGWRQFARLPASNDWRLVREHIGRLSGAKAADFLWDGGAQAGIDFVYKGQVFAINDQFGEYWFFVQDPRCRDGVLCEVKAHWEELLGVAAAAWLES
jgi:hypothetical protein